VATQIEGMQQLAHAFLENPDTILQELVNAAISLCGADSAGISLEREARTDDDYYHWVATAGEYRGFLDTHLPRSPSACSVCLERGRPQLFRVTQRFFDLMGVTAPLVTDGLLLPWQVEDTRGTIWIMAHGRTEAFDSEDLRMMQLLADFVAMGVRQQRQQKLLVRQASNSAAAAMANDLAHNINNPLQSVTNVLYLAERSPNAEARALALELSDHVQRLSSLVSQLLALPRADHAMSG
jgi:signal transduction histidine kinase